MLIIFRAFDGKHDRCIASVSCRKTALSWHLCQFIRLVPVVFDTSQLCRMLRFKAMLLPEINWTLFPLNTDYYAGRFYSAHTN